MPLDINNSEEVMQVTEYAPSKDYLLGACYVLLENLKDPASWNQFIPN
jgi:hypothetical protein